MNTHSMDFNSKALDDHIFEKDSWFRFNCTVFHHPDVAGGVGMDGEDAF